MNAGKIPPNWSDLILHSSEIATDEDYESAQIWSLDLPPIVPESGRAPNPDHELITNPYAVVRDSTIGKNKGTLFNSPQFPADMASEMACVVPVNSAGRLTQSPTFSANMAADMACG